MKATFEDFLNQNPNCNLYKDAQEMRHVFDKIISRDDVLIKLAEQIGTGKPALAVCAQEIADYFDSISLELKEDKARKQAIGRMIKTALRPFGGEPEGPKSMPKVHNPKKPGWPYFSSANAYKVSDKFSPTLKVVKKIEKCD